ncbi:hypothetical protein H4J02_11105 [Protaetiibacter sp. SSC-01]|uniref:hypothetical protein n=1 Tax=Protaetiibacter sp. SSC-01 TaxID=2759943 RepID=UPI0016570992|nr:hypothetical protein [Protaetiibacter sp. SSC-01]QNO37003.1 hypothetical protein H4J02_11105 [Protaetiibacter sp. SSC-01]
MRWDELFADIESQLEHELDLERQGLAVEEERLRLARLALRDRVLEMGRADAVVLVLADGTSLALRVGSAGRDWVAGECAAGAATGTAVVPLAAVAAVLPVGGQLAAGLKPAAPEALTARLGLGFVLRDLCRRRAPVEVRTRVGVVHGTIDRVARDHLDLAEHESGEVRRDAAVRRIRLVPFDAVLCVRA